MKSVDEATISKVYKPGVVVPVFYNVLSVEE